MLCALAVWLMYLHQPAVETHAVETHVSLRPVLSGESYRYILETAPPRSSSITPRAAPGSTTWEIYTAIQPYTVALSAGKDAPGRACQNQLSPCTLYFPHTFPLFAPFPVIFPIHFPLFSCTVKLNKSLQFSSRARQTGQYNINMTCFTPIKK